MSNDGRADDATDGMGAFASRLSYMHEIDLEQMKRRPTTRNPSFQEGSLCWA
ncbi:MAG TPA: hypothetical protein PKD49_05915 [Hyphomicrobium sp.]|nr:hypothetical protein [Hyphomicrobium sp.]